MARKPNYDFERKERERLKNAKKASRDQAKNSSDEAPPEAPAEAMADKPEA